MCKSSLTYNTDMYKSWLMINIYNAFLPTGCQLHFINQMCKRISLLISSWFCMFTTIQNFSLVLYKYFHIITFFNQKSDKIITFSFISIREKESNIFLFMNCFEIPILFFKNCDHSNCKNNLLKLIFHNKF